MLPGDPWTPRRDFKFSRPTPDPSPAFLPSPYGQGLRWKTLGSLLPTLSHTSCPTHQQTLLVPLAIGARTPTTLTTDLRRPLLKISQGLAVAPDILQGFCGGSGVKNLSASAEDMGLIPVSGRSPGEGNGNSLQYSCLGKKPHGQRRLADDSLWG